MTFDDLIFETNHIIMQKAFAKLKFNTGEMEISSKLFAVFEALSRWNVRRKIQFTGWHNEKRLVWTARKWDMLSQCQYESRTRECERQCAIEMMCLKCTSHSIICSIFYEPSLTNNFHRRSWIVDWIFTCFFALKSVLLTRPLFGNIFSFQNHHLFGSRNEWMAESKDDFVSELAFFKSNCVRQKTSI